MLLQKENSILLLVDVQEKLTPLINNAKDVIHHCQWIMELATELAVPTFISEQYPQGLGSTIKELHTSTELPVFEKTAFSCWRKLDIQAAIKRTGRKQVLLIGIETHVCILQTALDLIEAGYGVFIVIEAVGSRSVIDNTYGLKRIKNLGGQLITREMVFFEWIGDAASDAFKRLSTNFLQKKGVL